MPIGGSFRGLGDSCVGPFSQCGRVSKLCLGFWAWTEVYSFNNNLGLDFAKVSAPFVLAYDRILANLLIFSCKIDSSNGSTSNASFPGNASL